MNVRRCQVFVLRIFVLILLLTGSLMAQEPFAAEGIPPGSDYVYRQQYDQVQEILKLPDIAQREASLETYMKKLHPDSKILQYMEAFFGQIQQDYTKAGQTAKAKALTDKMLKMFPESDASVQRQFQSAISSKDHATIIKLGEEFRAKKPNDAQLLVTLLQSYEATKNTNKMIELAPKLIEVIGGKKAIYYVVWLASHYLGQNDTARAIAYYRTALNEYPSGVPQGWNIKAWNEVKARAFGLEAGQAWSRKDYQAVIQAYSGLLQADPKNDGAYLFIGLSYWRLSASIEDQDKKMEQLALAQASFARAVVLGGANSAKAREYLEQIYKPLNKNSLDGLDAVLDKARADMKL